METTKTVELLSWAKDNMLRAKHEYEKWQREFEEMNRQLGEELGDVK